MVINEHNFDHNGLILWELQTKGIEMKKALCHIKWKSQ